jgi:hypothetical protein
MGMHVRASHNRALQQSEPFSSQGTGAQCDGAIHRRTPLKNLNPDGRTVTVIGKGFPANVELQLQEATGSPLVAQALVNVNTNQRGMFIARVLVAFDFTVLNPFPLVPTCSEPTFTGDECLLFATMTESPFASAFTPIRFSP